MLGDRVVLGCQSGGNPVDLAEDFPEDRYEILAPLGRLPERYRKGECELHARIIVRFGALDPRKRCLLLKWFAVHPDLELWETVARREHDGAAVHIEGDKIEHPVLVDVVEVTEGGQNPIPSWVRLCACNEIDCSGGQAKEPLFINLLSKGLMRIRDRERKFFRKFRWIGPRLFYRQRINEVIQHTTEVIQDFPGHDCPALQVGKLTHLEYEGVLRAVRVTLRDKGFSITVVPSPDFLVERFELFVCPIVFQGY